MWGWVSMFIVGRECVYYGLKSCIFIKVDDLSCTGSNKCLIRLSRNKFFLKPVSDFVCVFDKTSTERTGIKQ
jgi:hypothetical protein